MAGSIESPGFGGILIDQEFDAQVEADKRAAALAGTSLSTYLLRSGQAAAPAPETVATGAGEAPDLDNELKRYREYLDKKLQLEQEYRLKSEALQQDVHRSQAELVAENERLHRQLLSKLAAADLDYFTTSGLWSLVGDKLGTISSEALRTMLAELQRMQTTLVQNDPLHAGAAQAAANLSRIYEELGKRNPFAGVVLAVEAWQQALAEVVRLQEEVDRATEQKGAADAALAPLQRQVEAGERGKGDKAYSDAVQAQARALGRLTTAQNTLAKAQGRAKTAQNAFVSSLDAVQQKVAGAMDSMKGFVGLFDEELGQTIGNITGLFGAVSSAVTGISTSISTVGGAIDGVGKATTASLKAVETASVVLTVITAAFQIATAIANLFSNSKEMERIQKDASRRAGQLSWERAHAVAVKVDKAVGNIAQRYRALCTLQTLFGAESERFGNLQLSMSKRVASALRENEQVTREVVAAYASLDYSVSHALSGDKFRDAQEQMQSMAQQMTELNIQLMAEQDKNKGRDEAAIQQYRQQIGELGAEMAQLLGDLTEGIIGSTPAELADKLGTAFIEAFAAGEDAAKAWGKQVDTIVSDIIKRMILMKVVEPAIAQVFDKYQKIWFDTATGEFAGFDAVIGSMGSFRDDMNEVSDELDAFFRSFEGWNLLAPGDRAAGQQIESLSQGIQGITEHTAGLLASYVNAMYQAQAADGEVLRSIRSLLIGQRIDGGNLYLAYLQQISANTFNSARAAAQIAAHMNRIVMPRRGGPGLALNVNA